MKWNKKVKPELGEKRVVRQFLWLPKCLMMPVDHKQTYIKPIPTYRWLEYANVSQVQINIETLW